MSRPDARLPAIRAGAPQQALRARGIPPALIDAIVAGLHYDPKQRAADLQPLLRVMERCLQPTWIRRKRAALLGLGLGFAAAALMWIQWSGPVDCDGSTVGLASEWNEGARARVLERVAAIPVSHAVQTGRMIVERLDNYTQAWTHLQREVCVAHRSAGRFSADQFDASMACLGRAGQAVDRLVRGYSALEPGELPTALAGTLGLPDLDDCLDPSELMARRQLPDDPARRREHLELEQGLTRCTELFESGDYVRSLELSDRLIESATTGDHLGLLADLHIVRGHLHRERFERTQANEHYRLALRRARASGRSWTAARAALQLVHFPDEGETIEASFRRAQSLIVAAGSPADLHAKLLVYRAMSEADTGRLGVAIGLFESGIRLLEEDLGLDHPNVGTALYNLAWALELEGRHVDALAAKRRAFGIWHSSFGPSHPTSLFGQRDLAAALVDRGDWRDGLELSQAAHALCSEQNPAAEIQCVFHGVVVSRALAAGGFTEQAAWVSEALAHAQYTTRQRGKDRVEWQFVTLAQLQIALDQPLAALESIELAQSLAAADEETTPSEIEHIRCVAAQAHAVLGDYSTANSLFDLVAPPGEWSVASPGELRRSLACARALVLLADAGLQSIASLETLVQAGTARWGEQRLQVQELSQLLAPWAAGGLKAP